MPRDPKVTTLQQLARLQADYESAKGAWETLAKKRRLAIAKAVAAGNSKASVGRVVSVSGARVSALVREPSGA